MDAWQIIAGLALLEGVALIAIGWRGRRLDDHPLCRRCGFDLTGRPTAGSRCAECGADITGPHAVRVGHRRHRVAALFLGLVLALPALLLITTVTVVRTRDVDVTPYKPGWLLSRDLAAGGPAANVAFDEFARRLQNGTIADHHVAAVADYSLAKQAEASVQGDGKWGQFLAAAQLTGKLPPEKWATFAAQSFLAFLDVDGPVRPGQPAEIRLHVLKRRLASADFVAFFDWTDLRIDGKPVKQPTALSTAFSGHHGKLVTGRNCWIETSFFPQITGAQTMLLQPGPHELTATVPLSFYALKDVGLGPKKTAPDPRKLIGSKELRLQAPFYVEGAGAGPYLPSTRQSPRSP